MKASHKKQETPTESEKTQVNDLPIEDDRYPGSFFKVPGTPRPGKTAWRLS